MRTFLTYLSPTPRGQGQQSAGTILESDLASGNTSYVLALVALGVLALIGLAAALRLPATPPEPALEQG